nr:hypothetical protein CFP56_47705 [Quercus suber]
MVFSWKARVRRQRRRTCVRYARTQRRAADTVDRVSVPRRAASATWRSRLAPTRPKLGRLGSHTLSLCPETPKPSVPPSLGSLFSLCSLVAALLGCSVLTPSLTPISIARLSLLSVLSGCSAASLTYSLPHSNLHRSSLSSLCALVARLLQ